jgi:hypothetical protein
MTTDLIALTMLTRLSIFGSSSGARAFETLLARRECLLIFSRARAAARSRTEMGVPI